MFCLSFHALVLSVVVEPMKVIFLIEITDDALLTFKNYLFGDFGKNETHKREIWKRFGIVRFSRLFRVLSQAVLLFFMTVRVPFCSEVN